MSAIAVDTMQGLSYKIVSAATHFSGNPCFSKILCGNGATGLSNAVVLSRNGTPLQGSVNKFPAVASLYALNNMESF